MIFGRKAWAAITGMLDKRAADIRAELDEAVAAAARGRSDAAATPRRSARQALRDAQAMLEHARAEAAQVGRSGARRRGRGGARGGSGWRMDRIGAAEKAAVTDVRLAAADIAARAAEQVHRRRASAPTPTRR